MTHYFASIHTLILIIILTYLPTTLITHASVVQLYALFAYLQVGTEHLLQVVKEKLGTLAQTVEQHASALCEGWPRLRTCSNHDDNLLRPEPLLGTWES